MLDKTLKQNQMCQKMFPEKKHHCKPTSLYKESKTINQTLILIECLFQNNIVFHLSNFICNKMISTSVIQSNNVII